MDDRPLSIMLAIRPPGSTPASISELRPLLEGAGLDVVSVTPMGERTSPDARWEAEVVARMVDEAKRTFRVWLEPAPRDVLSQMLDGELSWRGVLDEDRQTAMAATWAMTVCCAFEDRPLWDYQAQLLVLRAVAPDAVCVLDTNAFTPRTGAWLHDAASSLAPPPFESLYAIHCVGDGDDAPCWLHTHGLERCGSIELDLVDVPANFAGLAAQLLNVVSAMFIETGVPEPDEPFFAGHELELLWLPWEAGVRKVSRALPGSADDRDEAVHAGARGILFAPSKGMLGGRKYQSVSHYREILEGHPLLYLSNMATTRATLLAKERLPRFRAMFERFSSNRDEWLFLMKLGYRVDGGDSDSEREHLWFDVHAIESDQIDATLLNQPHAIASMHEGQRASHAMSHLSDWAIMSTHGRFEPDSIGELERYLEEAD